MLTLEIEELLRDGGGTREHLFALFCLIGKRLCAAYAQHQGT